MACGEEAALVDAWHVVEAAADFIVGQEEVVVVVAAKLSWGWKGVAAGKALELSTTSTSPFVNGLERELEKVAKKAAF